MENHFIHHTRLDQLYERFAADQSDENSSQLIAEIVRLCAGEAEIIGAGITKDGMTQPEGYYASDGRFYFHIFSGPERFEQSSADHPVQVRISDLYETARKYTQTGGFSLNYKRTGGTLLISKEDIAEGMELYVRLHGAGQKGRGNEE